MLENRPIVAIALGYILGIIMGLYCKISIVLFYFIFSIMYFLCKKPLKKEFKLISFKRYFRYIKIIFTKKVLIIIIISSVISNTITILKNKQYEEIWNKLDNKEITIIGKIVSNVKQEQYKKTCKINISTIDNKKIKPKTMYLQLKRNIDLQYGDEVSLKGVFLKPEMQRNYKGFDYGKYLKTQGIYGTIKAKEVKIINSNNDLYKILNKLLLELENIFKENFDKKTSSILVGMILGDTSYIEADTREEFTNSNLSHILAISGMHIGYIIAFISLSKYFLGKRRVYLFSIIILVLYMLIIGIHPSAIRASIMAILMLFSKLIYKKSDIFTNISISILSLLIYNPFLILNSGLVLSYIGTIAIILYSKIFRVKNIILNLFGISLSVYILIQPILAVYFNQTPVISLFTSAIISAFAGPIIIFSFLFLVFCHIKFLNVVIKIPLELLVKLLLKLTNIIGNMPLNKMYVTKPNLIKILIYYIILSIIIFLYQIYFSKNKWNFTFKKRIQNLVSLSKYKFNQNKKKCISIVLILIILFSIIKIIPKDLRIYFIDVGQGDSCLIVTPHNKKILIDGGGSETGNYDVGKNILLPYLLDRGIKSLDYVIISHFDTDHVGGLLTVMEELKVDKAVISKQGKTSENYEKFNKIAKEKHTKVLVVGKDDSIKIEKDIFFNILWPNNSKLISENVLNNNSIVCKFQYKNFSMLFTGDIEEIAEKQILHEYKTCLQVLNSTVLKVGHHGSKTSSIQEFVDAVKPKVALIGVGKNNTFGHPNDEVVNRLKNTRCKRL